MVLALLPDRGKTMQWGALIVTLITFGLTLHLPAHYVGTAAAGSFQFVTDVPWIAAPLIRYHLGVDGLGMWLVVLTGLLAPLGRAWFMERDRLAEEDVLRLVPAAAGRDAGDLRGPGPLPLLRVLGAFAGADDDSHRDLRPYTGSPQGSDQVLHLRVCSVGLAAGRDSLAVCEDGHLRSAAAGCACEFACDLIEYAGALALLACIPVCFRGQGSYLSAAWLVEGCDRRGTDCDGHGARRQDGTLFDPALLVCDLS